MQETNRYTPEQRRQIIEQIIDMLDALGLVADETDESMEAEK